MPRAERADCRVDPRRLAFIVPGRRIARLRYESLGEAEPLALPTVRVHERVFDLIFDQNLVQNPPKDLGVRQCEK